MDEHDNSTLEATKAIREAAEEEVSFNSPIEQPVAVEGIETSNEGVEASPLRFDAAEPSAADSAAAPAALSDTAELPSADVDALEPLATDSRSTNDASAEQEAEKQAESAEQSNATDRTNGIFAGKKMSPKRLIGIAAGIVAVIIAVVVGMNVSAANNEKEEFNTYIDNLNLARSTMLTGAADAENIANLTKRVWYSAIHESKNKYKWDTDIQQYYASDFNEAIAKLYDDPVITLKIGSIKDNQDRVNQLMKKLQKPPEGCEAAYQTLDNLYDAYFTLTNLAVSPTGNYNSFSSEFNTADNDVLKYYKKLEPQIPSKK